MFSVIMPIYNASGTVVKALESVRMQTTKPIEIIAVDDCSTDDSVSVVEKWMTANPDIRVILIRNAGNKGPAAARNLGIEKAKGNWLAFIDADDEWLPDKLSLQKQFIESDPEVAMLCGRTASTEELIFSGVPAVRELTLEDFALANPVATSTVAVKTEVVRKIGGFDESFCGPEDYDLWMRIASEYKIAFIEKQLAVYGEGKNRISFDDTTFLPQVKRVIEKAYSKDGVLYPLLISEGQKKKITSFARRKAMAWQHLSAAWAAAERGTIMRAMGLFLESLFWWPLSFKPERKLPLGRIKIIAFIIRKLKK